MGDKDGARELLNEVIKEGDNAQQQRARSMLEALR
jgi:FimV-like protein